MLNIDILKLLKNKVNYIFLICTTVLLWSLTYKDNVFMAYFDISREIYLYHYLLKLAFIFVILLNIVNLILSYREDFRSKVINIIYNSKTSAFSYVIAKYFVHTIYFFFIYTLQFCIIFSFYIFRKELNFMDIINQQNIVYLVVILAIILVINAIILLIVTIFNNTNLALAITFLFLAGSKYIVDFLEDFNDFFRNLRYTFFDIINRTMDSLNYNMLFNEFVDTILILSLNAIMLLVISVIFNKIKFK